MSLTERERLLIGRRAGGEHAINPQIRRIVDTHSKNRDPEDAVLLQFARLTVKKSWSWDDYVRLQRAVLAEIPEPWGPPWWKQVAEPAGAESPPESPLETTQPKQSKRRTVTCGICSGEGHNARTCPNKPDTPTVKHTDGIERLSPGFDPNPPGV